MDIINDKNFSSENRTVVTFGKFDGIHTGHKLLINKAVAIAEKEGLKTILCTFDMRKWKSHSEPQITDVKEKEIICNELGVDILLEIPFDDSIALLEPEEFINEFIRKKLNAEYVVVGTDWKFGKDRKGDVESLVKYSNTYGYTAVIEEKITIDNREISSTWIRDEIKSGNMEKANELLGYPYFFYGMVESGKKLGRTIGFPTINLSVDCDKILPPYGVYASIINIGGRVLHGVTNVGVRPTVDDDERVSVETYIFDFDEQVYGEYIMVELVHFIRKEKKFESLAELKKHLESDIFNVIKFYNKI